MARLEELKVELTATVTYAENIGARLEDPDLGKADRADLEAELEAAELKATSLQREIRSEEKTVERELRIKAIGRDIVVPQAMDEPQVANFRDPVEALLKSEQFEDFREAIRNGSRDAKAEITWKAAADVTSDQAGDLVTQYVPGITNLNYTFPTPVGDLFSQAQMDGSNVSFVKMPTAATGDAQYQTSLGGQKGGTFAATLDVAQEFAKVIAAVATIPAQNLDDINALEGEVRNLLLVGPNGLAEMREDAYINGAGGSSEIQGILDLGPADSTLAGDYVSKSVVKAVADIKAQTGFTADAVVVSPEDWFAIVTEVGTEDNRPLNTPWGGGWGIANSALPPLVVSRKLTPGQLIVGAFSAGTRYVRQGVTITADQAGLGLRDKNLVLFVAEVRELVLHRYGADPFRVVTVSS